MLWIALLPVSFALDCAWEDHVLPANGTADVAISAAPLVLSVYPQDQRTLSLVDADGAEVPHTVELSQQGDNRRVRLRPTAPLAANATYSIKAVLGEEAPVLLSTFTTEAASDTTAPTGGGVREVIARYELDGDWGEERLLHLSLNDATDDDPLFYEVQLSSTNAFMEPLTVISVWPSGFFGVGLCETTWAELPLDTDFHLRARAVDLSDNATDWWEGGVHEVPSVSEETGEEETGDTELEVTGRRCSSVPGFLGGLWLVLLMPLARRRRAR